MRVCFRIVTYFLLICLCGVVSAAHPAKITGFRFALEPTKIRLVFDTTAPLNYTVQPFSNRVVINIKNAKSTTLLSVNGKRFTKTSIASITTTQHSGGLHIAVNLKQPMKLQHFLLPNPYRLVVDLYSMEKSVAKEKPSSLGAREEPANNVNAEVDRGEIPHQTNTSVDGEINKYNGRVGENVRVSEKGVQAQVSYDNNNVDINGGETPRKIPSNSIDLLENLERDLIDRMYGLDNKENGLRDIVVVIDPGHGGKDPGAIGSNGTREKDVTLAVAKALQKALKRTKGFHAILTRNGDYFIPLRGRLGIAHSRKADIFISIHADAYKNRDAHGVSIFALSQRGATSEAARWLAEKENESELGQAISDKNALLRSVLIDLAQTATTGAGLEIGKMALQELSSITHIHTKHVEQAAFVVLKSPDIPSILVEVGFLSHNHEEHKLRSAIYQQEIAAKLAAGIESYFMRRPPIDTYLAQIKQKSNYIGVMLKDSLPG